nr:MAG TPA: hypothetical protein [Caudoviricetes sp.]DAH96233.1 MAG TPA: hypothetical protein [Caudoviricetes sp.]
MCRYSDEHRCSCSSSRTRYSSSSTKRHTENHC